MQGPIDYAAETHRYREGETFREDLTLIQASGLQEKTRSLSHNIQAESGKQGGLEASLENHEYTHSQHIY